MVVLDAISMKENNHVIDLESGASESEGSVDSLENLLVGESLGIGGSIEKSRRKNPKPPRPPKPQRPIIGGQKLVGEISDDSMLGRARLQRMKAFKKMKKGKRGSSNGYFCALVITIVFCAIIIWKGVFSKSRSSVRFHGTPESLLPGLVEFPGNLSGRRPRSSILKQVAEFQSQGEAGRARG